MTPPVRQLQQYTRHLLIACYRIPDAAFAVRELLNNAVEAGATSITIFAPLPFSTITVTDNGNGFTDQTLSALGRPPIGSLHDTAITTTGLFLLSRLADISVTSRAPGGTYYKKKIVTVDGNHHSTDVITAPEPYSTKVEVANLFASCPAREKQLGASSELQYRSILKCLTNFAITHPLIQFSWRIGTDAEVVLPGRPILLRLTDLFQDVFPSGRQWLPISFSGQNLCVQGIILRPSEESSRSEYSRMIVFERKLVQSPEIRACIDATWTRFSPKPRLLQKTKPTTIFYIEISDPQSTMEVIQGTERSTQFLRLKDPAASVLELKHYMEGLLRESANPKKPETRPSSPFRAESFAAASYPPYSAMPPTLVKVHSPSLYQSSSMAMSIHDIWLESNKDAKQVLQRSSDRIGRAPALDPIAVHLNPSMLNSFRVLGQFDKRVILVLSNSRELVAFDQHAVHERIRFEHFLSQLRTPSTPPTSTLTKRLLATPITYSLSLHQFNTISMYQQAICKWCWSFDLSAGHSATTAPLSGRDATTHYSLQLREVPVILGVEIGVQGLVRFAEALDESSGTSAMPASVLEVVKSKACRGAIMFGDELTQETMDEMLKTLRKCRQPFACAHGRPSAVLLASADH